MFTTINTKSYKKILGEIVLSKIVEGFFILLGAAALVRFISSNSTLFLLFSFLFLSARLIFSALTQKLFAKLSVNVQNSFRFKIHQQIFYQEAQSGDILTLIFDTLQSIDEFLLKVAPQIVSAVVFLPIFLICAAFTDFLTAFILLITLPIAPVLLWLIGKATSEKNSRAWAELHKLNGDFREILAAITTLKLFNRLNAGKIKIRQASEKSSAATLDVLKLAFVSSFALELITTLSIALVAVTLGLRLVAGNIQFQPALFLLLLAPEFFLPIRKFGIAFHVVISARSSLERLKSFLIQPKIVPKFVGKILMPPSISLINLSFAYPLKKSPVISNLNLNFSAGKITALIGDSGSGKSTILKLLAGILTPNSGEILWNDLPTSKMEINSRISKVSYVPQAPHLFDAPLIDNLTMFDTLNAAELQNLLAELNLSTLNLSEIQKLSRGQLQRLGLIRALLKNSPIILLDEPTAGLDELSEQKIINLIKKISVRRTIIIATHRLAVIDAADEVIRL